MAEPAAGQFFDAQGKPLQGAALDEAWKSGAAHVAAGEHVHMLTPDGDLRLVPAEQVATARAKGYAPAPAEVVEQHALQREHGGIGGQIATVGESAADMATVGGYGYAAGKLSPEYAKQLLARREANPISHVAGSIVGLAPSLLTGAGEAEAAELGAKGLAEGSEIAHGAQVAEAAPGLARQALSAANRAAAAPLNGVGAAGGIVERGVARGLKSLGVAQGDSLGAKLVHKVATTGAAGAAEGALFGIGSTLSESSLEGKDLTSEALVSGIGRNALFGGALGAGMGALSELGSAAVHAALPSSEELAGIAQRKAARAIGTSGKDAEKLGGVDSQKFKSTMDEMLGYEYQTGEKKGQRLFSSAQNVTDIHEGLRQAAQETGAAKRGIVEEIDNAIQNDPKVAAVAQPDVSQFFDRVKTELLDKLRKSDVMAQRRIADKIEKEIQPLREAYEATKKWAADEAAGIPHPVDLNAGARERVNRLGVENADFNRDPQSMRDLTSHRGAYAGATPEEAQQIARGEIPTKNSGGLLPDGSLMGGKPFEPVSVHVESDGQIHLNDGRHRLQAAKEAGATDILAKIRHYDAEGNIVSEEISPVSIGGIGAQPPEPITFARLDAFERDLGKRIYGENVKGAGIQVAPKGAKQLERVRGILSDFQDQNAERALAAMGEDPTKLATLNRQYSSFANLEKIAGREAGKAAKNRIASPTDHALGLSMFLGSLLSGNVGALGSMAFGAAATIANNFARTRGNSILADIAYRTSKMDNLLENTAHALSVSPERLAQPLEAAEEIVHHKAREELAESKYTPLGIKALSKDFEETTERVRALGEPTAQHEQVTHATKDISEHYPEQGAAMAAKLIAIHQHLQQVAPQPQGGSQISPLASKPRVPPREQARFLTRVNAALDPASVIEDIGKGKLDKDAIDTLKQTYPATYGVLRQKVMTKLAASEDELPYQRIIHLSTVFDFDGDPSLTRIAGIQQTIAQINAPPSNGAPGTPGPTRRGKPNGKNTGSAFALPGEATPGAH